MKNTLTFFLALGLVLNARAQSFIFSFGGGGDAPIARSYTTSYQSQVQSYGSTTYTQRVKPVSLGQGGDIYLSFDWFSKTDIGGGVRIIGFFGASFTQYVEQTNNGDRYQYDISQRGLAGQLIPHLSFRHEFNKITPIFEVGMLVGVNAIKETTNGTYNSSSHMTTTVWEKGGVSLGFYSSLGIQIKLSKRVSFSLAAVCTASSYSPTNWERTTYVVNGTDQLSQLQPADRYGNYVKEINTGTIQSPTSPRQSLRYSAPFSNVGLNVGFAFLFAKHKSHTSEKKGGQDVHSF